MTNRKQDEEIAFNKRYSRFKLQMFFPRRAPITHWGQERYGCTVAQIKYGHIKQLVLNREKGLQDCLDRIALCEKLYGSYQTALVYDRRRDTRLPDGTLQTGKEILKYTTGGILVESDTNIFANTKEKRILVNVVNRSNGNISLVPVEDLSVDAIDFKHEVANSLAQPIKPINTKL